MALVAPTAFDINHATAVATSRPPIPTTAGWGTELDFFARPPTIPIVCSAFIALVFALVFIGLFLAVGWRLGGTLVARDEEKGEVAVEEAERRSVVISIVSDTEDFPSEKKN